MKLCAVFTADCKGRREVSDSMKDDLARVVAEMREAARYDNGRSLVRYDAANGEMLEEWADRIEAAAPSEGSAAPGVDVESARKAGAMQEDARGRIGNAAPSVSLSAPR
jgi:hypothetical protein